MNCGVGSPGLASLARDENAALLPAHLQHAVDHLAGDPEIVRRIDQLFQLLAVGMQNFLVMIVKEGR